MKAVVKYSLIGVLVTMVVGGLLAAVIVTATLPNRQQVSMVDITIEDLDERQYVQVEQLSRYLQNHGCMPLGKPVETVSLHTMESLLREHPMLREAECYMTIGGKVCVRVSQRIPLLRVETAERLYIVDTDRRIMPVWSSVNTRVMRATGAVDEALACGELADMAAWLRKDRYWREDIVGVNVVTPTDIVLLQRNGQRVRLGATEGYARKLAKLRTFDECEWTDSVHYKEIDLRYKGQVVGRKN